MADADDSKKKKPRVRKKVAEREAKEKEVVDATKSAIDEAKAAGVTADSNAEDDGDEYVELTEEEFEEKLKSMSADEIKTFVAEEKVRRFTNFAPARQTFFFSLAPREKVVDLGRLTPV